MFKTQGLEISFSGQEIFKDVNVIINKKEKVGFIGRNGSGKSTFLKLILGQLEPDSGEIIIPKGYKIGHLEQHIKFSHDTVLEEVCSILTGDREYEGWKGESILTGLGFTYDEMMKNPNDFSGGFQVKINLAKLLLDEPNMLLLDEPTNYLDIHSIRWLKKFLNDWRQEIILITHDRDFMNSVISHTLNIHRGIFKKTSGNTENVMEKILEEEEIYNKTVLNESKKREKTEEWIKRFGSKASMASRAQSKIKMLEKNGRKEKLAAIANLDFKFNYLPYQSKENLLNIKKVNFFYKEENYLIKNVSFSIKKTDKICVIGKNGKGKSTLLKLITGDLKPISGDINIHQKTNFGYFGQMNIDRLSPNNSVYQEIQSYVPEMEETKVRQVCGSMMFSSRLSGKPIKVLSGGEKSRVMLGKILLKPANLLMLDEPTNHLDLDSCESLLQAIKSFDGAVMMVTHDEYFLREVANKLVIFDDNKVTVFEGSYDDFLSKVGWKDE
ncbi:MAG: ABC-F family ATP-binding cassette domain-containing protein [Gammaproteobacteria bacterium]|nr:ABC-F family ATP-binding cassette domain-containing protein [Gammaproteobacteria bacterium]